MVGWGIAAAVAVLACTYHDYDPLRSRRVESAAAMERRARAGSAKEKKGTKGTIIPGAAPVPEIVQIWTISGTPSAISGRASVDQRWLRVCVVFG